MHHCCCCCCCWTPPPPPPHCASVQPPKNLMRLPYTVDLSNKSCSKTLKKNPACSSVQPPKNIMRLPYTVDRIDKSCSKNLTKNWILHLNPFNLQRTLSLFLTLWTVVDKSCSKNQKKNPHCACCSTSKEPYQFGKFCQKN